MSLGALHIDNSACLRKVPCDQPVPHGSSYLQAAKSVLSNSEEVESLIPMKTFYQVSSSLLLCWLASHEDPPRSPSLALAAVVTGVL